VRKKMRILFLSNRGLIPIKDGHTRRSFNILKGLAEANDVYFLSLCEFPEEVNADNIKMLEKICSQVEFLPSPPKKISMGMVARLLRSLVSPDAYTIWRHYSKHFLRRVDRLISSGQFDLVHCDNLPICYAIRDRKDIFRSVTDHDVSYLKCLRMGRESRNPLLKMFLFLEALKLRRLERTIFKQVDLGIVVSELDMSILQKLCPEGKFFVIENGVDIDALHSPNVPEVQNKLVWLGGFDHYPNRQGIHYFLEKVYPLVKQKKSDVSVDIVGGGVTDDIRLLAGKPPGVHLTGYVDDPAHYIQRASVFVAPIISGGGTKLKVLEAMAAGKAIVSTSIGCEGINGTDGVHFIIADDEQSFAKAIITLLDDNALRTVIGNNARILVEREYNYKEICNKLNLFYHNIIKS